MFLSNRFICLFIFKISARICSEHFSPASYMMPLQQQLLNYAPKNSRNLKSDAVPTEKLPAIKTNENNTSAGNKSTEREERMKKREKRLVVQKLLHTKNTEILTDDIKVTYQSENPVNSLSQG